MVFIHGLLTQFRHGSPGLRAGGRVAESGVEAGESPKLPEQIKTPLKREAY